MSNQLMPSIPSVGPRLQAASTSESQSLGTVYLTVGDNKLPPLKAEKDSFVDMLQRASIKFG